MNSASEDGSVPTTQRGFDRLAAGNTARGIVHIGWHQYLGSTAQESVIPGTREGELCRGFGDAGAWPRTTVLAAGNWNPNLNAYEESELYGPLRALGGEVPYRWVATIDSHVRDQPSVRGDAQLRQHPPAAPGPFKHHAGFQASIADHWQSAERYSKPC